MKKLLLLSGFFLLSNYNSMIAGNSVDNMHAPAGKKIIVYTTADNTKFRMSATDTLYLAILVSRLKTSPACLSIHPKPFKPLLGSVEH